MNLIGIHSNESDRYLLVYMGLSIPRIQSSRVPGMRIDLLLILAGAEIKNDG